MKERGTIAASRLLEKPPEQTGSWPEESPRGEEKIHVERVKAMLTVQEGSPKGRRQFPVTAGRRIVGSHLLLAEDPPVCAAPAVSASGVEDSTV